MDTSQSRLTAAIVAVVILSMPVRSQEPRKAESLTLDEAFHMRPRYAESVFGSEPTKKLQDALEDFNAVLSYRKPVNAKLAKGSYLTDGAWSPIDFASSEAIGLRIQILFLKKGMDQAEVEKLLKLDERNWMAFAGSFHLQTIFYSIGKTHTLSVTYVLNSQRNGWILDGASLQSHIRWLK